MTTPLRLGVHEDAEPTDSLTRYPAMTTAGPYYIGDHANSNPSSLLTRVQRLCTPAWKAGLVPLWTWKPDPAGAAAGRWDTVLHAIRDYHVIHGLRSMAYPWHEPENDMDSTTFVSMFSHVHAHLSAAPYLQVGYTAMSYQWRPDSKTTPDPAAWAVPADFYAIDVYSGQTYPPTTTLVTHPGFQRWWTEYRDAGPFYIAERGFDTSPYRVATIQAESTWLLNPAIPVRGYQIWNSPGVHEYSGWLLGALGQIAVSNALTSLAGKTG